MVVHRDGVVLVQVPAIGFFKTGQFIVGNKYEAKFEPRIEGEDPVMQIINNDEKIPCKFVDIVLYRADVLAEDNDRSTDADWEIISINGKDNNKKEPMTPTTMARNQLHLKGGTQSDYSAREFAESIMYWNKRG